ncbi:MAG: hypothetical protein ACE5D8_09695 [Fidelibacterota bacterium]
MARLFPPETDRYAWGQRFFRRLAGWQALKPEQWMGFWIMYGAGVATRNGARDRYYFWDFSHWVLPVLFTFILTILVAYLFKRSKVLDIQVLQSKPYIGAIIYLVIGVVLFMSGWAGNPLTGLYVGFGYFLALLSIYAVFMVPLEEKDDDRWFIGDQKKRLQWSGLATLLALVAMVIGIMMDDPVVSTASAVWLPFPLVALIAPHARHIRRCRIYGIFIYGFFIAMRAPWLLVYMFILYHGLRKYNYFRYGIVKPTLIIEVPKDEDETS